MEVFKCYNQAIEFDALTQLPLCQHVAVATKIHYVVN